MIDAQRIDMIIQEGEGLTVDFKEHFSPRIIEDVAAFAKMIGLRSSIPAACRRVWRKRISGKYRSDEMSGSLTSSSGWTRWSLPAQASEG